jgi:hypothetical protein
LISSTHRNIKNAIRDILLNSFKALASFASAAAPFAGTVDLAGRTYFGIAKACHRRIARADDDGSPGSWTAHGRRTIGLV